MYTVIAIRPSQRPSFAPGRVGFDQLIDQLTGFRVPAGANGGQRAIEDPRVGQARCGHETAAGGWRRGGRNSRHLANAFIVSNGRRGSRVAGAMATSTRRGVVRHGRAHRAWFGPLRNGDRAAARGVRGAARTGGSGPREISAGGFTLRADRCGRQHGALQPAVLQPTVLRAAVARPAVSPGPARQPVGPGWPGHGPDRHNPCPRIRVGLGELPWPAVINPGPPAFIVVAHLSLGAHDACVSLLILGFQPGDELLRGRYGRRLVERRTWQVTVPGGYRRLRGSEKIVMFH